MSRMDEYLMAIITGENEDLPEPRSSTEREFYEAAKKGFGGGGASSWNDLTDKPFGEETIMGDTLTWDGDITGKPVVSLDMGEDGVINFCKVSNAVPTIEDLSGGVTVTASGLGTNSLPADALTSGDGYIGNEIFLFISKPNATVEGIGLTFPETGTWVIQQFVEGMSMHVSEIIIPNYTGFEMVEITPIDPKYLPNSSSGSDRFVINMTLEGATFVVDKTFSEIVQAIESGKDIVFKASNYIVRDYIYYENVLKFKYMALSQLSEPNGQCELFEVEINSLDVLSVTRYSIDVTYSKIV